GPGEADITINVQELEKAGRMSLGDLLEKKVNEFGSTVDKYGARSYIINDRQFLLIIDGIDIRQFMIESDSLYVHTKKYLDYFDAEEIQGIEIMTKKSLYYGQKFLNPLQKYWEFAFVEVTTRSGHGPFIKKMVGTYLYKPLA